MLTIRYAVQNGMTSLWLVEDYGDYPPYKWVYDRHARTLFKSKDEIKEILQKEEIGHGDYDIIEVFVVY